MARKLKTHKEIAVKKAENQMRNLYIGMYGVISSGDYIRLQKTDPKFRHELQEARNCRIALITMKILIEGIQKWWNQPDKALSNTYRLALSKLKKNVGILLDFVPVDLEKKRDHKAFVTLSNNIAAAQNIKAKVLEETNPEEYIDITKYKDFGPEIAGDFPNLFVMWEIVKKRLHYMHPDSKKHVTAIKQAMSMWDKLLFDSIMTDRLPRNRKPRKQKEGSMLEVHKLENGWRVVDHGYKWSGV